MTEPGYVPFPGEQPPTQQKSGMPGWAKVLIGVFIALVLLCVVAGVGVSFALNYVSQNASTIVEKSVNTAVDQMAKEIETSAQASAVPVQVGEADALGQTVTNGDLEITVKSGAKTAIEDSPIKPDAGEIYYAVTFEVHNAGSSENAVAGFGTQMQDGEGKVYPLSMFGQVGSDKTGESLMQILPAGDTKTITYVYEVPENASELYWVYHGTDGEVTVRMK